MPRSDVVVPVDRFRIFLTAQHETTALSAVLDVERLNGGWIIEIKPFDSPEVITFYSHGNVPALNWMACRLGVRST
jgi:hypothetical protein